MLESGRLKPMRARSSVSSDATILSSFLLIVYNIISKASRSTCLTSHVGSAA